MNKSAALIALLLIAAVGGAARCRGMAERTLSFDEAFSWRLTTAYPVAEIIRRTGVDVHPPLYYLLLKPWIGVFGDGPTSLRSPSVGLAVATLVLVYALARDVFRWSVAAPDEDSARAAGVVAALLVATSGAHIRWSGEARMYSLACLLGVASTWLLARGALGPARSRRGDAAVWSLYALTACLALYTHNYMIFLVAGQVAWILLFGPGRAAGPAAPDGPPGGRRLAGLAAAALAVAAYAPWIPVLLWQAGQVHRDYWFARPSSYDVARSWADLLVPRNQMIWGDDRAAVGLVVLSGAVVAWLAVSGGRAGGLLATVIASTTLAPVAITLYRTAIISNQTSRYWLVASVLLLAGVAVLLCRALRGAERWLFVAVLVANNIYWWAEFSRQTRLDLMGGARAMAEYIRAHGDPDEPIAVREPTAYLRVRYYLRNDPGPGRLHLVPKGPLALYNGGPVIAEGETEDEEVLDAWADRKIWAVDGGSLLSLMDQARLPEPWRPAGPSRAFPEPIITNGKLVLTESIRSDPPPRPSPGGGGGPTP
jgi:mannosyltransferase